MASYASLFSASELQFKFDLLLPVMLMQRAVVHTQSKSSPTQCGREVFEIQLTLKTLLESGEYLPSAETSLEILVGTVLE